MEDPGNELPTYSKIQPAATDESWELVSWKAALSQCDEILRLSCSIFTKIDRQQLNKPGHGQPTVTQSGDKADLAHGSARE